MSDRRFLLALWTGCVALRLAIARSHAIVGIDEALYFAYGDSWLRTGTYSGIQWPVPYALVVAALSRLMGARAAIDAVFVLGGSLTLIPLFHALKLLRGSQVARWGAGIAALLPAVSAVTMKSGTHALYLPLLALGFLLHARALVKATTGRLLALGAVLGAAYVTRTDGLVYCALIPASLLVAPRDRALRARIGAAALVALAAAIVAFPNVLHVRHHTGQWQASAAVGTILEHPLILGSVKDESLRREIETFRAGEAPPLQRIASHPGAFLKRVAHNARAALRILGDMHGLTLPVVALAGLGAARLLSGGGRLAFLALAWATPPLAFLALHVEPRYLSPTSLFLSLLAAEGCVALHDALRDRGRARFAPAIFGALAASLLVMSAMTAYALRQIEERDAPRKADAARRLAGDRLPETFILNPHVRFLVDGRRGAIQSAPMTRRHDSRWLIFDAQDEDHDEEPEIRAEPRITEAARDEGLVLYERSPGGP